MRYGMVIDLRKCIGCDSCTMACKQYNATPQGVFFSKVLKREIGSFPSARMQFQPMLCMHCKDPQCVKVCPTGASSQRKDGIVVIDKDKCMGCRYCVIACPYDARTYLHDIKPYYKGCDFTPYEKVGLNKHQTGIVVKCDFCLERLLEEKEPICVQTCPAKARTFGDLDDPYSEVYRLITSRQGYQLHSELGTGPSVYYIN
jgi:Fe-S-cluster-containing dehydrogenase component